MAALRKYGKKKNLQDILHDDPSSTGDDMSLVSTPTLPGGAEDDVMSTHSLIIVRPRRPSPVPVLSSAPNSVPAASVRRSSPIRPPSASSQHGDSWAPESKRDEPDPSPPTAGGPTAGGPTTQGPDGWPVLPDKLLKVLRDSIHFQWVLEYWQHIVAMKPSANAVCTRPICPCPCDGSLHCMACT